MMIRNHTAKLKNENLTKRSFAILNYVNQELKELLLRSGAIS